MFSKLEELAGMGLLSAGVAEALGLPAGLIAGGACLLLVGATTDDAQVAVSLRRGFGWLRFLWHRQLLREQLAAEEKRSSPHPLITVDPELDAASRRAARSYSRRLRGRVPTLPEDEG